MRGVLRTDSLALPEYRSAAPLRYRTLTLTMPSPRGAMYNTRTANTIGTAESCRLDPFSFSMMSSSVLWHSPSAFLQTPTFSCPDR